MSFTFLHTADWQLGKPFASIRDEAKRHRVQHERLLAVERLAGLVTEHRAQAVLVAGDLFDSPKATKATVSAACAAIGSMKAPVFVIPGNHDHGGPGSVWEQPFFLREQEQLAPNMTVLLKAEPVILEGAVILPAPLQRKHESTDPTAWIRAALTAEGGSIPTDRPRIVLAHGTVQGFTATAEDDDDLGASIANWIDLSRLPMDAIDYVALGDWHGVKQLDSRAWYAGALEPDRFPRSEDYETGQALKVTVHRGGEPEVEKLPSGKLRWQELTFTFSEDTGLDLLAGRLEQSIGARGAEHLIKLTLEGSLGMDAYDKLEQRLESWESRLLRLKLNNRVTLAPSMDEVSALTERAADPLTSAVARQLVNLLQQENEEEGAIARVALRELHAACAAG